MHTKIVFFWMVYLLLCSSCRLFQQRNRSDQLTVGYSKGYRQQLDRIDELRRDSQFRYWYFWTDSSFYLHPDKGLTGEAGLVLMQESKVGTAETRRNTADVAGHAIKNERHVASEKRRQPLVGYVWMVLILGIFVFLYKRQR